MGLYLTTDIVSPKVVAVGGQLTGNLTIKWPSIGHFYGLVEQYSRELVVIPGSRAYLYQAVAGGSFVNSTINYSVKSPLVVGVEETIAIALTLLNTDCYLYVFLKQIPSVVLATALVAGTTYKILTLGTTNFTLYGASANTVGTVFVATVVGAGTGTVCTTPNPDTDDTIDTVDITTLSVAPTAAGIDMGELMNLMITMMIVMMMMKMMMGMMQKA